MVRSNELGCRNGWNRDLWVPANADGQSPAAQPIERIGRQSSSEVEFADQSDLITSIVAAKTDNVALQTNRQVAPLSVRKPTIEEDIFVNQKPAVSWSAQRGDTLTNQPATELVQNPKAAILRARDQFRQRRKSEGRLADRQLGESPAPFLASSREAHLLHEHDLAEPALDPTAIDPRYENRPLLTRQLNETAVFRRPVSPVSLNEIDRPFPSLTDFPDDRVRFESVPALVEDGETEPHRVVQDDTWIETRQVDAFLPEPYVVDDFFEEEDLLTESGPGAYEEVELSVRHRESIINRLLRQRRERKQLPESVDQSFHEPTHGYLPEEHPVEIDAVQADTVNSKENLNWISDVAPEAEQPRPAPLQHRTEAREERSAPMIQGTYDHPSSVQDQGEGVSSTLRSKDEQVEDDFVLPPPLPEYRPSGMQQTALDPRSSSRAIKGHDFKSPHRTERSLSADEFGDQPLFAEHTPSNLGEDDVEAPSLRPDRPSYVTPRLDRICQTCRDFRPSDTGERGWCNNKWAFNHRRMVDAEDLACRNSLGSWWTPKDESWRRDGDISRHSQQTPRVDQWLLGSQEVSPERRRSGS